MNFCPFCNKIYVTKHFCREAAMETNDTESREQWISGCCSTKCWDKAMPPEDEPEEEEEKNAIF